MGEEGAEFLTPVHLVFYRIIFVVIDQTPLWTLLLPGRAR